MHDASDAELLRTAVYLAAAAASIDIFNIIAMFKFTCLLSRRF